MSIGYGPTVVTQGLVLALDAADRNSYPGSGTTWDDLSGNGNNGTLSTTYTHNSAEGFLKFSGSGVATISSLLLSSVTWEIFYRSNSTDSFSEYGRILDFEDTTISIGSYNTYQLRMWTNAGGSRSTESVLNGVGNDNKWHHIIYSYDGSTTTFYFDAIYQNGYAKSGALNGGSSANLTIGNGDANLFNGDIAVVRVYNRALTASEIQQNFNALRGRFNI
jgi:hypothetical protein